LSEALLSFRYHCSPIFLIHTKLKSVIN
jgi:hypothetical protein